GMFTFQQMGNTAGKLDDLNASLDAAHGIGNRFSMLFRDQSRKVLRIRLQQGEKFLHDTRPAQRRRIAPGRQSCTRGLNRTINVGCIGHGDVANHISPGGIRDFAGSRAGSSDGLAADPEWNGFDLNSVLGGLHFYFPCSFAANLNLAASFSLSRASIPTSEPTATNWQPSSSHCRASDSSEVRIPGALA